MWGQWTLTFVHWFTLRKSPALSHSLTRILESEKLAQSQVPCSQYTLTNFTDIFTLCGCAPLDSRSHRTSPQHSDNVLSSSPCVNVTFSRSKHFASVVCVKVQIPHWYHMINLKTWLLKKFLSVVCSICDLVPRQGIGHTPALKSGFLTTDQGSPKTWYFYQKYF